MRTFFQALLVSAAFIPAAAYAQDTMPASDAEAADETGEIVVFGQGQSRQVQTIRPADISILTPGSSPLRAIEKLPSVNVQSADPFGSYEWSTRVTIRGFNQNQLGFNLDGIPLGDMTYGNNNGLHISRATSSDNIGRTTVSQGSGSITTQSTNNLGGTLEFFTADPNTLPALTLMGTYGSSETARGFARVRFGKDDGVRGFASVQLISANKWKGEGQQQQFMVNGKLVAPLGDATVDAYYSYSDRAEDDYQDLSQEMIGRLGYDWDNFGKSKYLLALQVADIGANRGDSGTTPLNPAAGTVYPAPIASLDDAYYDASGLRRDHLGSIGLTSPLGGNLTLRLKGYLHLNEGQGTWGTPYVNSPTGVPMALRTTEYDIERSGFFGSVEGRFGDHTITVGGWYENNDFTQARRFYSYQSRTSPGIDHMQFQRGAFFTQWEIGFNTRTLQYYVQDEFALGDLTINLGWKGFQVDNKARAIILGGRTVGDLSVKDWFQPHAGFSYKLGDGLEAFGGFTQVTRAYVSSTTAGPFSSTQAGFDAIKPLLKPESSNTYELGLRLGSGGFHGVVAVYTVDFRNRLLTIPTSVGIVGAANALQNVGSVRARGVELTGEYRTGPLTLFASYSYNDNTYRNDVVITTTLPNTVIPTAGKTVVDSPKHLLHGEVGYDDGNVFAHVGAGYMSKRYFTYTNDRWVDGRTIVDASVGFRFKLPQGQKVELQMNVTNLFDLDYVSTIGSNGFGNSGDNQTLLAGAPRQIFATMRFEF
ncbi:MAG: TonB-dependent receptor [Novosphingobium sp.]|uniref:TonB-dependent receptor n=1 Tax=Novosphingobium sp. TaxID=1874826 RepID=UPI003C7C4B41